jgi:guanylate kinase
MLFVITGPSGCGKSTLAQRVLDEVENLDFSISYTTRRKRESEREGKDYYFVSKEEFEEMTKANRMLEWAAVHGHYYGTSRREIEKKGSKNDLLLDIDVQGAHQVKERIKKAVFIFILPPSYHELKARLEKRGEESSASMAIRLETAKKEIRHYPEFDFIVVNDELERAVKELAAVILSLRCKLEYRKKEITAVIRSFTINEGE